MTKRPWIWLATLALMAAACGGTTAETTSDATSETTSATTNTTAEAVTTTAAADEEATTTAAGEWQPEFVDGILQPLPDGFPNQDITVIVADNATSAEGILMQNLVDIAGNYSPVAVRAEAREDFEAFGSWEALRYAIDTDGGD